MKFGKLFLLITACSLLLGCEKSYPTYYDIDGEYVIDQVIVIGEDVNGNRWDTTLYSGTFSLTDPRTPLDSFKVGVTRFKFTDAGRTFKWNKQPNPMGGDPWMNSAYVRRQQDILSGEWDVLKIDFELGEIVTRVFEIEQVGIDDFQSWITQYPYGQSGPEYRFKYYFHEVGP